MKALALGVLLVGSVAHAEPVRVHLEAAATIEGGHRISSLAFRGYLGLSTHPAGRGWQPFAGAGGHLGSGILEVPDPRAIDGTVELGYTTFGPELRAGLTYVDGGVIDSQLYVAVAPLTVGVDPRLSIDPVGGVHGGRGLRAAIGITYADQLFGRIGRGMASDGKDAGALLAMAALLPETFEVTWERSGGSDRTGASFGWGF